MGTWRITVEGLGIHHNHLPKDANILARKFVDDLKNAGHTIGNAEFQLTNGDGSPSGEPENLKF